MKTGSKVMKQEVAKAQGMTYTVCHDFFVRIQVFKGMACVSARQSFF